jgi:GntR family transcriptional regulator
MADPMWRQIAEDLRQKIEAGELGADGKVPSELELRDMYNASRNTVRDAVKSLVIRGLIVTRPGQGTFVVKKMEPFVSTLSTDVASGLGARTASYRSEVSARSRKPTVSEPRVEIQHASPVVAEALQLSEDDNVVSRHQERFIDGTPWSLQTSFYPFSLVESGASRLILAADIEDGAISYIEDEVGLKRSGRADRIFVRAPDHHETSFFSLPDDGRIAVFEIVQTIYDDERKPYAVTITTYPSDRNQFLITAGKIPSSMIQGPTPAAEAVGE